VIKNFKVYWSVFDLSTKQVELSQLEKQSEDPKLWDNRENALAVMKKVSDLRQEIEGWQMLEKSVKSSIELAEFEDESLRPDIEKEIQQIEITLSQKELSLMLSGPYDKGNAILAVHAGAGGTDSQDWAAMLFRMYLRWTDKNKYKTEILDQTEGEEAGIKSTTISVNGDFAYGYLRSEKGVHRLVRLSPFDSAHRRHTSFALVEVLPEVNPDDSSIQINPEDIRIDVYKSSGAGGQNVQKNATAVRITHFPTGIVVSCQNERSQMQNRENALKVLKSKLLDLQREDIEKQMAELRGEYTKAEWGSQIRSYVLHPYQMVKDHRTEFEVGNAQSVLDGDIDGFIEAYLKSK
jgi:peptide chain release factor 2